jgi:putative SOS response-associated peptidase YedK
VCGRYRLTRFDLLRLGLRAPPLPGFEEFTERPRWNVAPSQRMPIVRMSEDGSRELAIARWGLVPSWAKEMPKVQPINARAESAATSGMFRQAMARRRCLVPADGFYEWQGAKPPKQPFFIHKSDDGLFCFAGLWERWRPPGASEVMDTYTILTTTPNQLMSGIYNRMPVILQDADYDSWLDMATGVDKATSMLKPYADGELEAYPVSRYVNSPKNDDPQCAERV